MGSVGDFVWQNNRRTRHNWPHRRARNRYVLPELSMRILHVLADIKLPFGSPGCLMYYAGGHIWRYWIPSMIFEPILFLLAIGRLAWTIRATATKPSPVLTMLIRDSIVYFGGEIVTIMSNLIVLTAARVSPRLLTVRSSIAESSIPRSPQAYTICDFCWVCGFLCQKA